MPTPAELSAYTGRTVTVEQATAVLSVVRAMVSAHTRGVGFTNGEPNAELSAVILSSAARLLMNTGGLESEQMAAFVVRYGAEAFGFTLPELVVLNRYRVKAK
ncbi:hypothetical protein ACXPWS_04535 [Mycobacterium sp. BMJ-28]